MAIFEIFEVMKAKLSRLPLTPMKDDGGKWSSPIFEDLAHFSIVENL